MKEFAALFFMLLGLGLVIASLLVFAADYRPPHTFAPPTLIDPYTSSPRP